MNDRIEKVRIEMRRLKLGALFITNQYNVSYLTGFSGFTPNEREGFFLLSPQSAYLLTFPTYFGLYKNGGTGFTTLNITPNKRMSNLLNEIIEKENIEKIGIEKNNLTLGEFESLSRKLKAKLIKTEEVVEKFRLIKDASEIESIKKACETTDLAFSHIKKFIKKGISEKNLAIELEYFIKKNADDIAFPPIIAFNENAAIPHYLSNNIQHLTNNSLILCDFGIKINGYCSDMTRIIFFGEPDDQMRNAYQAVLEAQALAIRRLKVGIKCGTIDSMTKKYLTSLGYPEFQHGTGHGVGLAVHESPRLKKGSHEILKDYMVVTVEPGIYLENQFGIRIEDLVLLKEDGVEILSHSPKLLKSLIIK